MWVLFSVCWMVLLVVTLLFVLFGFVLDKCVGIWLFGLRRFLGLKGCSRLLLKGPLVMGLRICFLRVLLRLGFCGALVFLVGIGLACLCLVWLMGLFSIFVLLSWMLGVIKSLWAYVLGRVFGVVPFLMFLGFSLGSGSFSGCWSSVGECFGLLLLCSFA